MCSTKTCPTTGWTVWASRPPCTETRTAPGPCRRFTSTTVPRCTLTSTRTPPTPTPCLLVWAPPLTTLSREIKTLYTGRCTPSFRGETHSVGQACVQAWRGQLGWASGCKISLVQKKTQARCQGQQSVPVKSLRHTGTQTDAEALGRREAKRASLALLFFWHNLECCTFQSSHVCCVFLLGERYSNIFCTWKTRQSPVVPIIF